MTRIVEVKTANTSQIKTLFEVLKEILIDAPIAFVLDEFMNDIGYDIEDEEQIEKLKDTIKKKGYNKGGIRISSIDQTKTIFIQVSLDAISFRKFHCSSEKFVAGVNLHRLYEIIKTYDKNDVLTIFIDEKDKQYLSLETFNSDKSFLSTSKVHLIDIDNEHESLDVKSDVKIKMLSTTFHNICRGMGTISTNIEIVCTKTKIQFRCKGDANERQVVLLMDKNNPEGIKITLSKDVDETSIIQGIFKLGNLTIFSKCQTICKFVTLHLTNGSQLCMDYGIGAVGKILVAISPMIEDDLNKYDDEIYDKLEKPIEMLNDDNIE